MYCVLEASLLNFSIGFLKCSDCVVFLFVTLVSPVSVSKIHRDNHD
jgi:hypothetical protein